MKKQIQSIAKITGSAFLGWMKVSFIGALIMFIDLAIGFYLLADNENKGSGIGGHANGIGAILVLIIVYFQMFLIDFFPTLLTALGFLSIPLFMVLANKYAINKALYSIYTQKLSNQLKEKIEFLVQKFLDKYPNFNEKKNAWKDILPKLISENKKDTTSSWIYKKIINTVLKKIQLDDVNFSNSDISFRQIFTSKIQETLEDTLKPSMKPVWIISSINLVFIILAFVFNTK